jgi:hypothetical protein
MTDETTETTQRTPTATGWFSPRALRLHAVLLVVVPAFAAMCVWQITRALGGNELSWAYVFEWPIFAAYAVYMWWRLVHERVEDVSPPATTGGPSGETDRTVAAPAGPAGTLATDTPPHPPAPEAEARDDEDDPELAAYNTYLAELAERDRTAGR